MATTKMTWRVISGALNQEIKTTPLINTVTRGSSCSNMCKTGTKPTSSMKPTNHLICAASMKGARRGGERHNHPSQFNTMVADPVWQKVDAALAEGKRVLILGGMSR